MNIQRLNSSAFNVIAYNLKHTFHHNALCFYKKQTYTFMSKPFSCYINFFLSLNNKCYLESLCIRRLKFLGHTNSHMLSKSYSQIMIFFFLQTTSYLLFKYFNLQTKLYCMQKTHELTKLNLYLLQHKNAQIQYTKIKTYSLQIVFVIHLFLKNCQTILKYF